MKEIQQCQTICDKLDELQELQRDSLFCEGDDSIAIAAKKFRETESLYMNRREMMKRSLNSVHKALGIAVEEVDAGRP